jgi:hypothetical protein
MYLRRTLTVRNPDPPTSPIDTLDRVCQFDGLSDMSPTNSDISSLWLDEDYGREDGEQVHRCPSSPSAGQKSTQYRLPDVPTPTLTLPTGAPPRSLQRSMGRLQKPEPHLVIPESCEVPREKRSIWFTKTFVPPTWEDPPRDVCYGQWPAVKAEGWRGAQGICDDCGGWVGVEVLCEGLPCGHRFCRRCVEGTLLSFPVPLYCSGAMCG